MSQIRKQRRDPLPLTWEVPAATAAAWVAVAAMLLPAGRGAASWLTGSGWVWPKTGAALTASLEGLLSGHPSSGLAATAPPPVAVVYLVVALAEVAALTIALLVLIGWWRTLGPGMRAGLASRLEVEKVLGRSRMRRNRKVIRPDLYGRSKTIAGPS